MPGRAGHAELSRRHRLEAGRGDRLPALAAEAVAAVREAGDRRVDVVQRLVQRERQGLRLAGAAVTWLESAKFES